MVVKILSSSATFNGIKYNFEKLTKGLAELLVVKNFGPLQGLDKARQEDYKNYLQMLSARNTRIKQPQFHAVISTKGKDHTNKELATIGHKWLAEMGYGDQPYLVFFHKDTDDNHIHIVSTRIDRNGKKISSEFEHVRAVNAMNRTMGLDEKQQVFKDIEKARSYRFSTVAQFKMILENQGYVLKNNDVIKFGKKLAQIDYDKLMLKEPDQARARQLQAIFSKYVPRHTTEDFRTYMEKKHGVKLIFHAKDGKPAYGYSIIDYAQKNVFKGSTIMPLKELMGETVTKEKIISQGPLKTVKPAHQHTESHSERPINIQISTDVDDEKLHGRRRKKKTKRNYDRNYR